jgi:hypothetical protein
MSRNAYFDLTDAFNQDGRIVLLASGQAVVHYRLAIMSKDGDWIVRETDAACRRVRTVLAERRARYRPGAPLDPRWLAGGWSSHFELTDDGGRRLRCDFFSRPPRVSPQDLEALFAASEAPAVVDVESLIRMKRTQRAKDYPVIGELARLLPPDRELELTTDPDRVIELAPRYASDRPAARAAREGRLALVLALAAEADRLQQEDRRRVDVFERASEPFLRAFRELDRDALALPQSHDGLCRLAERLLPMTVGEPGREDAR